MLENPSDPSPRDPAPVTIRPMAPGDAPHLAGLFREMQDYYGVPCPATEAILDGLARLPPGTTILVAANSAIVGFASVCAVYPGPGLQAGLFLKELFVAHAARARGVGTLLMRAAARHAVEHGLARIDWTADGGNARLLSFYGGTGAQAQPQKLFFRLEGPALAGLAGDDTDVQR